MSFAVTPDSYDRFMGRYSRVLAPIFADFAGVGGAQRGIDVGCGPGALTEVLVDRLGSVAVAAIDPSDRFVAAARDRHPGVEVHKAAAEQLPFDDSEFDVALAQLVVHHMEDAVAGVSEMSRVVRPRGLVAACVWDHLGGGSPLTPFWQAVRRFAPDAVGDARSTGFGEAQLLEVFTRAGLRDVLGARLSLEFRHSTFDEWWEPFGLGVGPAGAFVAGLDQEERVRLRDVCEEALPPAPFTLSLSVWAASGRVS